MSEDKFKELLALNVNSKTEKRKSGSTELTYLSWSWAWAEFKKVYPDATYEIKKFKQTYVFPDNSSVERCVPYMQDPDTGYMVNTEVTAGGLTYEMWLPVMDGTNRAMKREPYEYETKYNGTKTGAAADMFDVNKTIMRCLVKNLAMFGLGLYIYAGEDLPEQETTKEVKDKSNVEIHTMIDNCTTELELKQIYKTFKAIICKTPDLLDKITKKGEALKKGIA